MKWAWTILGGFIVLMVLGACGGEALEPTGCVELTGEGLEPIEECEDVTPPPPSPTVPPPACPPDDGSPEARGCQLFQNTPASVGLQPLWCYQCHQIEGVSEGLIGPKLTHIATDAATRKPPLSAEEYIRESIEDPEAFICDVDRCTPGLMTNAIVGGLGGDEVDALVAFLLTLK